MMIQPGTHLQDSIPARLLHADSVAQLIDRRYVDLLESVNGQLAHRWNAYGVVFTILGILVAIFTIGAGAMIIFRDNEYKRQLQDQLDRFDHLGKTFLAEKTREFESLGEQIHSKEAERSAATEAAVQEKVDREIARLKMERDRVVGETVAVTNAVAGPPRNYRMKPGTGIFSTGLPKTDIGGLAELLKRARETTQGAAMAKVHSISDSGDVTAWEWKCPHCERINLSAATGVTNEKPVVAKRCGQCERVVSVIFPDFSDTSRSED